MKEEIKNAIRLIIIQSDQSVSRQNIKLEDKAEEMHGSLKENNENGVKCRPSQRRVFLFSLLVKM